MAAKFTLEYWSGEAWLVGRLKEVPGVFSQGETLDESHANIRDAYELLLADDDTPAPEAVEPTASGCR